MARALGLILAWLAGAQPAYADPLPFEREMRIGAPPRPVVVRLEAKEHEAQLSARAGGDTGTRAEATLPVPAASTGKLEEVELAGGARVAVVRVKGEEARAGALVVAHRGRPEILWTGRLDARGDPGEKRTAVLQVEDRTGDGHPDVIVGHTHEGIRICGQDRTVLFPRAIDPETLQLRPVVLRRLPDEAPEDERTLEATPESPGPEGSPLLEALTFVSASSSAGTSSDPLMVPAPGALGDGDPKTVWMEGHGGDGKWEFVTARFSGEPHEIRAIAITPSPDDAELAKKLGRPRSLWLVGDEGARIRVEFPEDPLDHPGRRYWVVPEQPLSWRCVSLVIGETYVPEGANPGSVRTAIAEVSAFTGLDFGDGIQRLVKQLASDGPEASEAARILGRLGRQGAEATLEVWGELSPKGRRRAVRVLGPYAATLDGARKVLVDAGRGEHEALRRATIEALRKAEVAQSLGALAGGEGKGADQAALALARLPAEVAVPKLLAAFEQTGGSARPVLRRALRRALRNEIEAARGILDTWITEGPPPSAAASVALALSPSDATGELAARVLRTTRPRAERFADRWRLVAAARELPSSPDVDGWLVKLASDADAWMLRAAAIRALAAREAQDATEVARAALDDDYPRVRAAALHALAVPQGDDVERVAVRARRDDWPLVRVAGVKALAGAERALPVLRAAVTDRSRRVREAAVAALTDTGDRKAWAWVEKRLRDDDEWPNVMRAAIAYVGELCIHEGRDALATVVDRAFRPDPWPPDVDLAAQAIEVLASLGGEQAEDVLERASSNAAPRALRQTAKEARKHRSQCPP